MPTEGDRALLLVGGVGELYQGDLDLGRVAVERLSTEDLGPRTVVEDLHYGAVAVVQRLEELRPAHLVLVGGVARGRPPGTVERRRVHAPERPASEVQLSVGDAVVGYVSIDLVVEVAAGLGALPARTVSVEVEPASTALCEHLSPAATHALDEVLDLVRAEARRAPMLELADRMARHCREDADRIGRSPAFATLRELLRAIEVLGDEGRWGRVHVLRQRLADDIDAGRTAEAMDALDWALWWALLEEVDRVLALESVG